jgi:hypothetical protein
MNEHIFGYLKYYLEMSAAPEYAVMINGPWGIGKTSAVKQFINKHKRQGIIYASLYGAKSAEDIDQRIIVGMMPALETPLGKIGGRIVGALAQKYGLSDLIKGGDVKSLAAPELIVFDDLERALMEPAELLGYINQMVEHEGRKAVILANEAEIKERIHYTRVREKVIGITFDFQQDVHAALGSFIAGLPTEAVRKHLEDNKDSLLTIFSQSGSQNLRVLKQTLWTWDRFYSVIAEELRAKTSSMLVVFKLFIALCLEVRSGALTATDLRDRVDKIGEGMSAERNGKGDTSLATAQRKYPELHLHDRVISDAVLVEVLCQGRISEAEINATLRSSEHFIRSEEEPAWQKLWYGITRPEDEFNTAFKVFEDEFARRVFVRAGEIMHAFGLRLWLKKMGQLDHTTEELVTQCKSYIDDLKNNGQLLGGAHETIEAGFTAAYGLQFMEAGSPEFKSLHLYYEDAVKAAKRAHWPAQAREVLELMARDVSAFFAKVCWTNDQRDNTFMLVPIFSVVAADDFVEKLLKLHPRDFRTALTALNGRYEHGRLHRELAEEGPWLHAVYEKLKSEASGKSHIRRYAIENEISRLIAPLLDPRA